MEFDLYGTKMSLSEGKQAPRLSFNKNISARFCHQVAAQILNMFCYFYFVKNHKISINLATNEAREKNKQRSGIL